jgi:hypothetical protein
MRKRSLALASMVVLAAALWWSTATARPVCVVAEAEPALASPPTLHLAGGGTLPWHALRRTVRGRTAALMAASRRPGRRQPTLRAARVRATAGVCHRHLPKSLSRRGIPAPVDGVTHGIL